MNVNNIPLAIETIRKAGLVPMFWGATGVGKSQGVMAAAKKMGIALIDLRLGQMDAGDLVGLPRVRQDKQGIYVTTWARPEWWPTPDKELYKSTGNPKYASKGIVFLDEFNRASTVEVIQAMFPFVLGYKDSTGKVIRKIHTHILPDNWSIVCAGNPDDTDYIVQSLDKAMMDRLVNIPIYTTKKQSIEWMQNNLDHEIIWKYVSEHPHALPDKQPMELNIQSSNRCYEMLSDMLTVMQKDNTILKEIGLDLFEGVLGPKGGITFYQTVEKVFIAPISANEVLNCRSWDKFTKEVLSKYINENKQRIELINITLEDILDKISKKKATKVQIKNLCKFLVLIPPDLMLKFMLDAAPKECIADIGKHTNSKDYDTMYFELLKALGFKEKELIEGAAQIDKLRERYKKGDFDEKQ